MKEKPLPGTPEFLTAVRKAMEYLPGHGQLRWKHDWSIAGLDDRGFSKMVAFQGRKYRPEELAWLIQTGEWIGPNGWGIGFRNGIDADLRWSNLFDARAQCEVTVSRCGDLFVLRNGEEQVVVGDRLDEVLVIAADILRGWSVVLRE